MRLIAIIATGMDTYQTRVVAGLTRELSRHGMATVVWVNDPFVAGPTPAFRSFVRRTPLTGFVMMNCMAPAEERDYEALFEATGAHAVRIGVATSGASWVRGDNQTGMRELMSHLLDGCGARRVVHVRGIPYQPDAMDRERVFREELLRRGIACDEGLFVDGSFDRTATYRGVRELLRRRTDVDAVVAANDLSALGALRAVRDTGLRVPEDVMITGFDNEGVAAVNWPGLTTVDQDLEGQGEVAARQLVAEIEGAAPVGELVVPSRLVIRGFTYPSGASLADRLATVTDMAQEACDQLAVQDAVLGLSRHIHHCATLDEVVEVLVTQFDELGINRCFVALREDAAQPSVDDHEVAVRLVLDYRDGRLHTPLPGPFPARLLLPVELHGELAVGALMMQPLSVAGQEFGYLLFERVGGHVKASEALHQDLSLTLEALFITDQLRNQAARLEALVSRRTRELESEVATRQRAEAELKLANDELHRLLMRDGLTRIANRSAFQRHLEHHWQLHLREGRDLALLMIDIDAFKNYNDHYGHLGGDNALRVVASCLNEAVREPQDLACRYGGEEFAVLLPEATADSALAVARRFQTLLAAEAIPHAASPVSDVVTVSIGVAMARNTGGAQWQSLVEAADRALYRAKALGRDRIVGLDAAGHGVVMAGADAPG
ncbi:MAG: diguanylate cyclase [Actinomycetales bacterium]|nr:diguanylate cyclase [Actinomycetales bacterium]